MNSMKSQEDFLSEAVKRTIERVRLLESTLNPQSLRKALEKSLIEKKRVALILEYKRCSPRGFTAYRTPWEFLELTLDIADAYSVLVEPYWFCGSLELLAWFTRYRPVLAKDFTVSPTQLKAYRANGASAALLILDALGWKSLDSLYSEAKSMGLEVLIETSNANDALSVMHSYPEALVGINARNLRSLKTDFENHVQEVYRIASNKPSGSLLVAESGVDSVDKVVRLAKAGADALLIGTWVMVKPHELQNLGEALSRQATE